MECSPSTAMRDVVCEVPYRIWQQLPSEIAQRIINFLPPNEVACTVRLVNRAAAAQFRGPRFTTVLLSLPVPTHAFLWRWDCPDAALCLTLKQRRRLQVLTARSGCVANMEIVVQRLGCPYTPHLLAAAASGKQREACLWLRARGVHWNGAATRAAAATGDASFCAWLLDAGCPLDDKALDVAAAAGHRTVCELLLARGCAWSASAACAAAAAGHADLLIWLLGRRPPEGSAAAVAAATATDGVLPAVAAGCDLPTLQRLHEQLLPPVLLGGGGDGGGGGEGALLPTHLRVRCLTAAVDSPTLDWRAKVEWLLSLGYPLQVDCWSAAAALRTDWPDRLEWLRDHCGLRMDVRAALAAARAGRADVLQGPLLAGDDVRLAGHENTLAGEAAGGGHVDVLQVLYTERGLGWDVSATVQHAAARGRLPVVVWLLETFGGGGNGGGGGGGEGGADGREQLLMREAATAAAGAGSLELLVWLHARGCRFSEQTFCAAAEWGSEEMLEWLAEKGCPMGVTGEPYVRAARTADLVTLRCLRRLGCPWGPSGAAFCGAVAHGRGLAVLRWLRAEGCPVDWAAAERVELQQWRKEGEVLEWIRAQRRLTGLVGSAGQRLGLGRLGLRLRAWYSCVTHVVLERLWRLKEQLMAALTGTRLSG